MLSLWSIQWKGQKITNEIVFLKFRIRCSIAWTCYLILFENKCATLTFQTCLFCFYRCEYSFSKSKQSSLDYLQKCERRSPPCPLVPRTLPIQVTYFLFWFNSYYYCLLRCIWRWLKTKCEIPNYSYFFDDVHNVKMFTQKISN